MKYLRYILPLILSSYLSAQSIAVDFGSRIGGTPIAANMYGTGISGLSAASPLVLLPAAGMSWGRLFVNLNQECSSGAPSACNFGIFGAQLGLMQTARMTALVVFTNTPGALIGAGTSCSPPTNNASYATYIEQALSYAQTNFPNTVAAIEIANEPDATPNTQFCPSTGTQLAAYGPFIAVVGPAVKAAFPSILVGMPALASPANSATAWFGSGGVISNWATPDFISYHFYMASSWSSWATLWAALQNATTGEGATFASVQSTLAGQGYTGPIWITEVNDGFGFVTTDCCRYDSTFSLNYNILKTIDDLNAVNSYSATAIPAKVFYFSNEMSGGDFCLYGVLGVNCANTPGPVTPYPHYYAYSLLDTMGLPLGGNVAPFISPASTVSGLSCTAWYNSSGDDLLCVNPTSVAINNIAVTLSNTGLNPSLSTISSIEYTLSATSPTASPTNLVLTQTHGTSYSATIATIPANSQIGLRIAGTGNVKQ